LSLTELTETNYHSNIRIFTARRRYA